MLRSAHERIQKRFQQGVHAPIIDRTEFVCRLHEAALRPDLAADARLGRWFSGEQIRTMREAVEDHRASASHSPRNIYGKIIAEADRDLEPEVVFQRTVAFALEKYPGKSKEEHWERFVRHLQEKYSSSGYIRLWIPGSKNEEHLKEIRHFIESPELLRAAFERCFKAASSAG